MKKVPYLSAVGSLVYLGTRPDISHVVSVVSRFNSNPGVQHWKAVQRIFRYIKGTIDYKICYGPTPHSSALLSSSTSPSLTPSPISALLQGYSDSDYGGCLDTGCSTSGYVFFIGTGPVSWSSKLQSTVVLSTTEAEYIASNHAGKEAMWFKSFLSEFGQPLQSPLTLRVDNQSAIAVYKNPEHRMKHICIAYHWIRERLACGDIRSLWLQRRMWHILTKALPAPAHSYLFKTWSD
jgi:hypothetical protein